MTGCSNTKQKSAPFPLFRARFLNAQLRGMFLGNSSKRIQSNVLEVCTNAMRKGKKGLRDTAADVAQEDWIFDCRNLASEISVPLS